MVRNLIKILFIISLLLAEQTSAQKIKDKFDKLILSENFDSSNAYWTTIANNDNLFIVQEGEYILNRKASGSPFAIIANYENEIGAFRLVTSLKLEKTMGDDGLLGILFMAQPEGKGGFIFDINKIHYM